MSTQEFSDQFDVLYNNITSNQAPGLNEYEKSLFLTKAQSEIVKNYLTPKGNLHQDGFDDTQKRQYDFSSIIRWKQLSVYSGATKFDPRAFVYKFPSDFFICLNEKLVDSANIHYTVRPISFEEYDRLMSKPYKFPPKYQAWRLITSNVVDTSSSSGGTSTGTVTDHFDDLIRPEDQGNITPGNGNTAGGTTTSTSGTGTGTTGDVTSNISVVSCVEIIGKFSSSTAPQYNMRYVKRPRPIILVNLNSSNLGSDLTIDGKQTAMTSELPEELHEEILQRAIELAKAAWTATGQDNAQMVMEMGKRSE